MGFTTSDDRSASESRVVTSTNIGSSRIHKGIGRVDSGGLQWFCSAVLRKKSVRR